MGDGPRTMIRVPHRKPTVTGTLGFRAQQRVAARRVRRISFEYMSGAFEEQQPELVAKQKGSPDPENPGAYRAKSSTLCQSALEGLTTGSAK